MRATGAEDVRSVADAGMRRHNVANARMAYRSVTDLPMNDSSMPPAEMRASANVATTVPHASRMSASEVRSAMPAGVPSMSSVPAMSAAVSTVSAAMLCVERIHKKKVHARGQKDAEPERNNPLTPARSYPGLYAGLHIHNSTYDHSEQGQHLHRVFSESVLAAAEGAVKTSAS